MAEAVFRRKLAEAGLAETIQTDSAGTANRRNGEPPDPRALAILQKYDIDSTGLASRPLGVSDYADFDLLLAMDRGHHVHMKENAPEGTEKKIRMFLEPIRPDGPADVPDPFYGDMDDYEAAFKLIDPACAAWIKRLSAQSR